MKKFLLLLFFLFAFSPFRLFAQFPWNNPLKIARSTDGITFTSEQVFQDSSGVPCAIQWNGDTLVAVFQWFRKPQGSATWDRVAVKFSYDRGVTWTEPLPIIIEGMPSNYQRPFDPTIVATDSGIRIYYSSSEGMPKPGEEKIIDTYSAFGTDGIHYTFEPGARFDATNRKVIDPAVTIWRGIWHFVSPIGAPQEGAYHAISTDGLLFDQVADIPSDNRHNWTGNFTNDGDSILRFFGSGEYVWQVSTDGSNWSPYTNTNIRGGDPTVVQLAIDSYIMIYVGQPYPTGMESGEWRMENGEWRREKGEGEECQVYNVMGQLIEETKTFDESRLTSGLYYVVSIKNSKWSGTTLRYVP